LLEFFMNLLLTHRAFARTWTAGLAFMLAWWSLHAVMLIHVFTLTGSPFATGLIPVFSALPGILFGPVAGALVDRWSRPRVMTVSAAGLVVVMLGAIPLVSSWGVALLYLVIFLQSLAMTFFSPAENALLPSLVPATELRTANALNALNDSIGRIAGPALGAVLLVTFGFQAALAVAAVIYLVGWAVLRGLREPPVPVHDAPQELAPISSLWRSTREGLALLRKDQAITLAVLVWALFMVADVPISAVLPAFMQDSVGVSPETFGGLMSVRGLTGLVGGALVVWLSRRVDEGRLLIGGLVVYGLSIATMGVFNTVPVAVLVLLPIGPASAALYTGLTTIMQQVTTDANRGRVFALSGTVNGIVVLVVSFTSGSLATVVGTQAIVIAAGCLQILPVLVAIVILRGRSRLAWVPGRAVKEV
jgi:MFS family permease